MTATAVTVAFGATAAVGSTGAIAAPQAHAAAININSFNNTFSAMKQLSSIAAKGKGKIAAIMPDTTSSTRYVEFDQPMIMKAELAAGLTSADIITPQNAQGSDTTFLS